MLVFDLRMGVVQKQRAEIGTKLQLACSLGSNPCSVPKRLSQEPIAKAVSPNVHIRIASQD